MTKLEKLEEALKKYHFIDNLKQSELTGKYGWLRWLAWRKLDFFPESTAHLVSEIKKEKIRLKIEELNLNEFM